MKRLLMNLAVLSALGVYAGGAAAQYKWVTPDGKTVYSDLPPATDRLLKDPAVQPKALVAPAAGASRTAPTPDLPYGLKITAGRSPVVLYTALECPPCLAARAHLTARGIPFTEKVVEGSADFAAFNALGLRNNTFPSLMVGSAKSIGFEAGAYDRLLDAAGYPSSSRLPPGYVRPAPVPLSPPQAIAPAAAPGPVLAPSEAARGKSGGRTSQPSPGAAAAGSTEIPIVRF